MSKPSKNRLADQRQHFLSGEPDDIIRPYHHQAILFEQDAKPSLTEQVSAIVGAIQVSAWSHLPLAPISKWFEYLTFRCPTTSDFLNARRPQDWPQTEPFDFFDSNWPPLVYDHSPNFSSQVWIFTVNPPDPFTNTNLCLFIMHDVQQHTQEQLILLEEQLRREHKLSNNRVHPNVTLETILQSRDLNILRNLN